MEKQGQEPKYKGAEGVLTECTFAHLSALDKVRIPKTYREPTLDQRLRFVRTRLEARLLARAKEYGVLCPQVYYVGKYNIVMQKLDGEMLHEMIRDNKWKESKANAGEKFGEKELGSLFFSSGALLAKIHESGIVHGDYTPANVMICKGKKGKESKETKANVAYVIDFGLGKFSQRDEDAATDILCFLKATGNLKSKNSAYSEKFVSGYLSSAVGEKKEKRKRLVRLAQDIDRRSRYMERGG